MGNTTRRVHPRFVVIVCEQIVLVKKLLSASMISPLLIQSFASLMNSWQSLCECKVQWVSNNAYATGSMDIFLLIVYYSCWTSSWNVEGAEVTAWETFCLQFLNRSSGRNCLQGRLLLCFAVFLNAMQNCWPNGRRSRINGAVVGL